jgi:hypothetical protein
VGLADLLTRNRRRARALANRMVGLGLMPLEEIPEHIQIALEMELELETIKATVARAWKARRVPEGPTSLERLEAVYAILEGHGILARHYPGAGRSEAYGLIADELAAGRASGRTINGFCFYDQFGAAMMLEGRLALNYGLAEAPPTYAQLWRGQCAVAELISSKIAEAGFETNWTGSAGDAVLVEGTEWRGPRDQSGNPTLPIGPRLDPPKRPEPPPARPKVINVFVAGPDRTGVAHLMIAKIAQLKGREMFGDPEDALVECAAVDYQLPDGRWIDIVAGPADPLKFGVRRDLAHECTRLLEIAPSADAAECSWWSIYPPESRLRISPDGPGLGLDDTAAIVERIEQLSDR